MRRVGLLSVALLLSLGVGCKKKPASKADDGVGAGSGVERTTTQATGPGGAELPSRAPGDQPPAQGAAEGEGIAPPELAEGPGGGSPDTCAAVVAKEFALIRESGTQEMRDDIAARTEAGVVAECQAQPPPEAVASCILAATTASELFRGCYTLPFQGRDLTVGRSFNALADNGDADPPVFKLDGDTMTFGKGCQMIHQQVAQFRGFFIDCDGQTVGPLTTGDDIRAAMAALAQDQAARHELVAGIMNNYPAGGTARWRVCDSSGNCRIQ
ncbi:MAG: hypothetical protein IT370_32725 [Deltaproteobacteria bacterium]|nr:hypothetical protein [Deltaproteobacteria bacterium]